MSRASSQQRFSQQEVDNAINEAPDWRQQKSLSRNDSQRSLTDYQQQLRQPDALITTRIEEANVEPNIDMRKPGVSFRNDDDYQQPQQQQQQQNLQQMAETRSPTYDDNYQQPQQQQQQYQEPIYDNSSYQQQPDQYQQDYSYGGQQYTDPQNLGSEYGQPAAAPAVYEQQQAEQYIPDSNYRYDQQPQQQEQPTPAAESYQPDSRRQSPEQEYQPDASSYVTPETPKRSTPPKRESPPRQLSTEESAKNIQQRQQSRDQLLARDKTNSPEEPSLKAVQQRQQSRDNLPAAKQMEPPSPARASPRTVRGKPVAKEQKDGGKSVGEASGVGRKSDAMQKQPAKAVNLRGKK